MDQKKASVTLSFFNILIGTVSSVVLTPLLISSLGDDTYSIYKVMQSFAAPLIMFNLGISTIVTRSIVRYNTLQNNNIIEKQNTFALGIMISLIMSFLVFVIGIILSLLIPKIFGNNYSQHLIQDGQIIFLLAIISIIFLIMAEAFKGCIIGHERFTFKPFILIIRHLIRVPLFIVFLMIGFKAITISIIDCLLSVLVFVITFAYAVFFLKEKPKLSYINKNELLDIATFSLAIFLQAIVNQVNNNIDTVLLGAYIIDKKTITMYSSALLIFVYYNSIVSIFSSLFLPKATRLIAHNASGEDLTDFVIQPGRFQAIVSIAIIVGFFLFGKEFITIWIGSQYITAYQVILFLIIPITIPLVEETAVSILDASLKRIFRSIVLITMALINLLTSIILIKSIGFWGAAIGTVISICIGHIILMNLYYKKVFKMQIIRMFLSIFNGILPMGIVAGLICLPIINIGSYSYIGFIIKGITFSLIYSLLIWKWGMKQEERDYILRPVKNIIRVK